MKTRSLDLVAALALAAAVPALAQHHAAHGAAPASAPVAAEAAAWVQGEVRRIDAANARVTLRHGDIPNLNMPPMTMAFSLRDPALLQGLKVGDKVRFTAVDAGGGQLAITALEKSP
ncbi:MAG: copper-binding protein [Ottowia sp.]|uniref:copper-binding protein n=1 Tax=Ottowia sp. TaxID=1898956 RepID=UPI0039E47DEA